jgi:hypothetical protein
VVAFGVWQVFMVLVIAALVILGGGYSATRPPDGSGR